MFPEGRHGGNRVGASMALVQPGMRRSSRCPSARRQEPASRAPAVHELGRVAPFSFAHNGIVLLCAACCCCKDGRRCEW